MTIGVHPLDLIFGFVGASGVLNTAARDQNRQGRSPAMVPMVPKSEIKKTYTTPQTEQNKQQQSSSAVWSRLAKCKGR
jgi:hypothetical protein